MIHILHYQITHGFLFLFFCVSFVRSFVRSVVHSFTHSSIHTLIHSCMHLFLYMIYTYPFYKQWYIFNCKMHKVMEFWFLGSCRIYVSASLPWHQLSPRDNKVVPNGSHFVSWQQLHHRNIQFPSETLRIDKWEPFPVLNIPNM